MIITAIEKTLLHISLIYGVGPQAVKRILACIKPSQLTQLYTMSARQLIDVCHLPEGVAYKLEQGLADTALLDQELQLIEQHDISWFSLVHDGYPALLREINLPPCGLYVRGTIPQTASLSLAVVGSRKANRYGQLIIDRIIAPLSGQGVLVVSGGAYGIDTMAHKAAIANNAPTVAVLGSGLLCPYPVQNRGLFETIITHGGAVVSAFPLTMEALAGNFPARNRIIAGLSQGCIVVQAAKKSGALITASYALEQGREVFAVPGPIDNPLSAGCHRLLQQGAAMACSADDIFSEFAGVEQKAVIEHEPPKNPEGIEERLVALCYEPVSVDQLSLTLALNLFDVQSRLFALQLSGRVRQNFMGLWHT